MWQKGPGVGSGRFGQVSAALRLPRCNDDKSSNASLSLDLSMPLNLIRVC